MKPPRITPGPWQLDGPKVCGAGRIADAQGCTVAEVYAQSSWPGFAYLICNEEYQANARFIAASWQVAEALNDLLAWRDDPHPRPYAGMKQFEKARLALLQAGYTEATP